MELEPGVTAADRPRLRRSLTAGRPGAHAVATALDPPLVRSVPGTRIRRHRRITGVSGIVLFACMFLPAIDACGTVHPYELPPLAPPYLFGLVFALIAMSRTPRALAHGIVALRALSLLTGVASLLVGAVALQVGIPEMVLAAALLVILSWVHLGEARVALAAIALAAVSMLWFAVWCGGDDALVGIYLSLASAGGLLAGGVLWWRELAVARRRR